MILKILSGVARAKGRFGKIAVAQMLTGSDSERMAKWRLDQLSTFGILRNSGFTQKEVTDIIDALAKADLVEAQDVDRFKPVIALTEAGWQWLKKQEPADLIARPRSRTASKDPPRGTGPGSAQPKSTLLPTRCGRS